MSLTKCEYVVDRILSTVNIKADRVELIGIYDNFNNKR